ncbi:MAG: MBL fold metallo-hydrolase [Nitrospirae bacterium]|nr:MBL fold metallo-hydrolase [Nitrospirota bacterium]
MKKFMLFAGLIFVFMAAGSLAIGEEAPRHPGLTKIAEGIYSYLDEKNPAPSSSFGANAGIIIGKEGIVVVDTLISSKEAQRFINEIKAISDKPIRYVVNTHEHLDHSLGNSDFIRLGAVVVSHANCKKNAEAAASTILQKAKNYGLTDELLQGTKVATASLTFNNRMEIDLGDRKVELIYTGASHTDGSILVYVPDARVIFAGDILFTDVHPYMGDGEIKGWTNVLDNISAMDIVSIVPGHGPLSTKKDLQEMRQYLLTFERIGRELSAQGKDSNYIAAEIIKAAPKRQFFEVFVAGNVAALYPQAPKQ